MKRNGIKNACAELVEVYRGHPNANPPITENRNNGHLYWGEYQI